MAEENTPSQTQSHFAHFERFEPIKLLDLYNRHAEVARDIHQDSLRHFTSDLTLTVDLIRKSAASADRETLEEMQKYDVISSSTEISTMGIVRSSGPANFENAQMYLEYFPNNDVPIYVTAAGNSGETNQLYSPRIADFMRTSLVVGEASRDEQNVPFVEKHSSRINPTLVSDSPFNRDLRYRMYEPPETLNGHEELIRDWLVEREVTSRFNDALSQKEENGPLSDFDKYSLYDEISKAVDDDGYPQSDGVNERIAHFLESPDELHQIVMSEVSKNSDGLIDAQGYTTASDGTSFSAPELAGYVSGALHEQRLRAEQGKPTLSKEEISALVKIATVDVEHREGDNELIHQFNNAANYSFSAPGGHGLFHPEMFRKLVDEAYTRIENNPDIDRENVVVTMHGDPSDRKNATQTVKLKSDLDRGQEIVIERGVLNFSLSVNGSVPHFVTISKPDQESGMTRRFESAWGNRSSESWVRQELNFGETLKGGENWSATVFDGHDAKINDVDMTIYGYNQGSLMDQMMQYGKSLEAQYEATPQTPVLDDVPSTLPAMKN